MGDRQMGNYGLRRASPKKFSQDYAYFGLKKDEPEAKKVKVDDVHIEFLSSPDLKKGRGRSRKTNPAAPEVKRDVQEPSKQQFLSMEQTFPSEEPDSSLVEVVSHAEEIISFDGSGQYVVEENDEAIQIMDFPIRIETVGDDSKKNYTEADDYTESGNEVKIECGECHKVLKPSSYRQHAKTHLGSKPHGCEICPARFTRRGDVDRHVRIVHNKDKPYFCHKCKRSFGDKKNLKWHLLNHDRKLFHVCMTCGFKFGKKDYYDNHVKFIHPVPSSGDNEAEDTPDEDEGSLVQTDKPSDQMLGEEDAMVIRKAVTIPCTDSNSRVEKSDVMELSEKQLQSILGQSQSNRIAIVGQNSGVKFLTVTPTNVKNTSPQVVGLKTLEKITKMSSQEIVNLHAQNEKDPSKFKAVVIEVDDLDEHEEQQVEEIVIGSGDVETAESANVDMIDALLDAAHK